MDGRWNVIKKIFECERAIIIISRPGLLYRSCHDGWAHALGAGAYASTLMNSRFYSNTRTALLMGPNGPVLQMLDTYRTRRSGVLFSARRSSLKQCATIKNNTFLCKKKLQLLFQGYVESVSALSQGPGNDRGLVYFRTLQKRYRHNVFMENGKKKKRTQGTTGEQSVLYIRICVWTAGPSLLMTAHSPSTCLLR